LGRVFPKLGKNFGLPRSLEFPRNRGRSKERVSSSRGGPVMTRKNRSYTEEFKREAVKLVTHQGYKIAEAARSLGINETLLGTWKRRIESEAAGESPGSLSGDERGELARLRAENKRLLMEREILKKAAAFFANEKK
jgi:transposase